MNKRILLVDGMALLFRGFFATSFRGYFMENKHGVPTNGVYQFLRYFLDAINEFRPSHVICCWDMGKDTFRTEQYTKYKANRDAPPEELRPQFDLVKEVVEQFSIPNVGMKQYEADDCIGTLARMYKDDSEVYILTGDQDILQLVELNVSVALMRKGIGNYEVYNESNFVDKFGLQPDQIVDLKGLMGDASDNIPGVRGIGEKTAMNLLTEYKTIDNILENIDSLTKGVQNNLKRDLEMLHLSRELATIKCDMDLPCCIANARWDYDKESISEKFISMDLENLVKTLI